MYKQLKKPVVGLFLDESIIKSLKSHNTLPFYRLNLYAEAAQKAGVTLILFSPGGISFHPDRLSGLIYDHRTQRWQAVRTGLPDIIYDRFVGDTPGRVQEANFIRHELNRRGIIKLNSWHYFDKLELYATLSSCENISSHLPPTREYRGAGTLEEMFKLSSRLYLKAVDGRRGKQVVQVTKIPRVGYSYRYFNERLFAGLATTLPALEKIIKQVAGTGKILIQPAVDLWQLNGRLIDLRGEMQRNAYGKLEIVSIPVRLGQKGSPITTHGQSFRFDDFFRSQLKLSAEETAAIKEKITSFLYDVYDCVERAYGPFGEIAIDFGFDRHGNIWLFECNAKSMKISLMNSEVPGVTQKAFLNPMLYARYLYSVKRFRGGKDPGKNKTKYKR